MSAAETSPAAGVATVFAALGDATRLDIVARLGQGQSFSITQLTQGARLTRQGMSKHLRVLEDAGLVAGVRVGRETRFALHPDRLDEARGYLDQVAAQWDAALSRLKDFVEETGDPT